MSSSRVVHWDTCVLLAWVLGEKRSEADLEGLRRAGEAFDDGKLTLLTSVISRAEIFQGDITDEQRSRYRDLFRRPRFQEADVTRPVAELASTFRQRAQKQLGKKITTPDAIHLATAAHLKAREFHTFDGDLMPLSESAIVDGLKVCAPDFIEPTKPAPSKDAGTQGSLPFDESQGPADTSPPAAESAPSPESPAPAPVAEQPPDQPQPYPAADPSARKGGPEGGDGGAQEPATSEAVAPEPPDTVDALPISGAPAPKPEGPPERAHEPAAPEAAEQETPGSDTKKGATPGAPNPEGVPEPGSA